MSRVLPNSQREAQHVRSRAWYIANKEKSLKRSHDWYVANKDRLAVQRVTYRAENSCRLNAQKKMYRAMNKEEIRERDAAYAADVRGTAAGRIRYLLRAIKARSKKKGILFDLDQQWEQMNHTQLLDGYCHWCGGAFSSLPGPLSHSGHRLPHFDAPSLDRVVPELGYTKENVVIVHDACNRSKNRQSVIEWTERMKRTIAYQERCSNVSM